MLFVSYRFIGKEHTRIHYGLVQDFSSFVFRDLDEPRNEEDIEVIENRLAEVARERYGLETCSPTILWWKQLPTLSTTQL